MGPLCLLIFTAWVSPARAGVTLSGLLGEKALISVDGGPPKVVAVGETHRGVKLLAVRGQEIDIEENGRKRSLGLGFSGGGNQSASGKRTVIPADGRGQFMANGDVNGSDARFLVDTGASMVVLPRSLAERAGVRLDSAAQVGVSTANGSARAYKVLLNSLRVGEIQANLVEALVLEDRQLRIPLLGMSFLNRVNMNREGDLLTLSQRY